jgi:hypothetical protein
VASFPLPRASRHERIFPADLSSLSDDELGIHLSYWTGWCASAEYQLAIIESKLIDAKQDFDEATAMYFATKLSKDSRSTMMATPSIARKKRAVTALEKDYAVVKALLSGYERFYTATSREVTRRENSRRRQ